MKHSRVLLPILIVAGGATLALARPILVDESHGQHWPITQYEYFSTARAELLHAGHTLTSLPGNGAITTEALAGYEVFVTGTIEVPYSPAEILALQQFVSDGGGVLCLHDGGWDADVGYPTMNQFLAPYGMTLASFTQYANGVVVTDFVEHCLTEDFVSLHFDYLRDIQSLVPPAEEFQIAPDPRVLGLYDGGLGWVIVCGDDTQWVDAGTADVSIADGSNMIFLHRLFGYQNCNESAAQESSWSVVKRLYDEES